MLSVDFWGVFLFHVSLFCCRKYRLTVCVYVSGWSSFCGTHQSYEQRSWEQDHWTAAEVGQSGEHCVFLFNGFVHFCLTFDLFIYWTFGFASASAGSPRLFTIFKLWPLTHSSLSYNAVVLYYWISFSCCFCFLRQEYCFSSHASFYQDKSLFSQQGAPCGHPGSCRLVSQLLLHFFWWRILPRFLGVNWNVMRWLWIPPPLWMWNIDGFTALVFFPWCL